MRIDEVCFVLLLTLLSLLSYTVTAHNISCRPTVFILGARKGGTTSLYHYLMAHPNFLPVVVGNSSQPDFGELHVLWRGGINSEEYNNMFPAVAGLWWFCQHSFFISAKLHFLANFFSDHQLTGEASVSNFVSAVAPMRLKSWCGTHVSVK